MRNTDVIDVLEVKSIFNFDGLIDKLRDFKKS